MELYNNPATAFVAVFFGSPQMNLFVGNEHNGMANGLNGVRPEHIDIVESEGLWQGKITHIERLGANAIIHLNTEHCGPMTVSANGDADMSIGQIIMLSPQKDKMCFFSQ